MSEQITIPNEEIINLQLPAGVCGNILQFLSRIESKGIEEARMLVTADGMIQNAFKVHINKKTALQEAQKAKEEKPGDPVNKEIPKPTGIDPDGR